MSNFRRLVSFIPGWKVSLLFWALALCGCALAVIVMASGDQRQVSALTTTWQNTADVVASNWNDGSRPMGAIAPPTAIPPRVPTAAPTPEPTAPSQAPATPTPEPTPQPTPTPQAPDLPKGLTAEPGKGQVTLAWNNPNDSSITHRYLVWIPTEHRTLRSQGKELPPENWIPITPVPSGDGKLRHTVSGLVNGTVYGFRLRAERGNLTSVSASASGAPGIYGTEGDDTLDGDDEIDYIEGRGGNDTLDGMGGDDWLNGGAGDDTLYGGDGKDRLRGEDGDDSLYGNAGDDLLVGHAGADTLNGGDGDDILVGGTGLNIRDGADILNGGAGNDTVSYFGSFRGVTVNLSLDTAQSGGDAEGDILSDFENIQGTDLTDILIGDDGDNNIIGFGGKDTIQGGGGNDTLTGWHGNYTFVFGDNFGSDTVKNFSDSDRILICIGGSAGEATWSIAGDTITVTHNNSVQGTIMVPGGLFSPDIAWSDPNGSECSF